MPLDVRQPRKLERHVLLATVVLAATSASASTRTALEACSIEDARLVAVAPRWEDRPSGRRAYFTCGDSPVYEVAEGASLRNGRLDRVGTDFVELSPGGRRRLFETRKPETVPANRDEHGGRMSVDYDGDVAGFAWLIGEVSGFNVVVEANAGGRVHISARDAPWESIVLFGLRSGDFEYTIDGRFLRIGCRGAALLERTSPPSPPKLPDWPIDFAQHQSRDLGAVMRTFDLNLGFSIVLPPGPYEPLTTYFHLVPANEAFDAIIASRGWKYTVDGKTIRIESAASPK